LFGVIHLIVEFMHKKVPPVKIVQVMPVAVAEDGSRFGSHSAGQAALWAFTRSLRRTFGNKVQVMEVILANQQENYPTPDIATKVESQIKYKHGSSQPSRARHRASLITQVTTHRIHKSERQGREIVVMPLRYRLSMCLTAILPWRLG